MNTKTKVNNRAGGCLVQLAGLIVGMVIAVAIPVVGWVLGPVVILIAIVIGSGVAQHTVCGECGNRVEKGATQCPTCGAR